MSDPAEVPISELEVQICELAGHIDAATGRFLEMLGSFDARGGWGYAGLVSCAHWLAWRCGLSLGAARERVRVARALRQLPVIAALARSAELSYAKVRALSRVATPDTEAEMAELARFMTASQCERLVRLYRRAIPPEKAKDKAKDNLERRYADTFVDDDGCVVIRARLSPAQGAVVLSALDAAAEADLVHGQRGGVAGRTPGGAANDVPAGTSGEALGGAQAPDPRPTAVQRRADALVAMAEAWLARPTLGPDGPSEVHHEVVIHVEAAVLGNDNAPGRCHAEAGGALIPDEVRRFACDGDIRVVAHGGNGTPMDVGRRIRAVPARLRRALGIRDDHRCRFPGCSNTWVDAHHVVAWSRGGATELGNLVLLCRRHHTLVHEGGWQLSYAAETDNVTVTRPDSWAMTSVPPPPRLAGDIESANQAAGVRVDPDTCASLGWGERMDYSMAVEGWLQINGYIAA